MEAPGLTELHGEPVHHVFNLVKALHLGHFQGLQVVDGPGLAIDTLIKQILSESFRNPFATVLSLKSHESLRQSLQDVGSLISVVSKALWPRGRHSLRLKALHPSRRVPQTAKTTSARQTSCWSVPSAASPGSRWSVDLEAG